METTAPSPAPTGARLLFFAQAASLGFFVLDSIYFEVVSPLLHTYPPEQVYRVLEVCWATMSLFELVALAFFTLERPPAARGFGYAALALCALELGHQLWGFVSSDARHVGDGVPVVPLLFALVALSLQLMIWLAASDAAGGVSPAWNATFYFLLGLSGLMSLGFMLSPHHLRDLDPLPLHLIQYTRLALSFTREGVLTWVVWRAAFEAPATAPLTGEPARASSSTRDLVVGGVWLGLGLMVTLGSLAIASQGSGGGRYVVTTGAIVYGVGRMIRGLTRRTAA